jgi:hypothetical protein
MTDDEKAGLLLQTAVAIANEAEEKGVVVGLDASERCLAMAQALAIMIGVYGRSGRLQQIAADMADVVATFPPIACDRPDGEVIH